MTFDPATGSFSFPAAFATDGTADGSHTVRLKAVDRAGNVSDEAGSTFVLDATPPTLTITHPTAAFATNATLTIAGTVADNLSGVAGVSTARHRSGRRRHPRRLRQLPVPGVLALDGSADGPHTVHFRRRQGGERATPASVLFTLDTAAPVVTIVSPAGGATMADVTVMGRVTDDLSGADHHHPGGEVDAFAAAGRV